MQLRFTSLTVVSSRRDLHPQECAHAGRTRKKAALMARRLSFPTRVASRGGDQFGFQRRRAVGAAGGDQRHRCVRWPEEAHRLSIAQVRGVEGLRASRRDVQAELGAAGGADRESDIGPGDRHRPLYACQARVIRVRMHGFGRCRAKQQGLRCRVVGRRGGA